MKILKWWKDVSPPGLPGITLALVPEQTAKQSDAFFDAIVEAVKAGDFEFVLYEQTDNVIEERR